MTQDNLEQVLRDNDITLDELRALRALLRKGMSYKEIAKTTKFTVAQLVSIFGPEGPKED